MKTIKSIALMAIGATGVLAYQQYSKPVMKKLEKVANKTMNKAKQKLDDMM